MLVIEDLNERGGTRPFSTREQRMLAYAHDMLDGPGITVSALFGPSDGPDGGGAGVREPRRPMPGCGPLSAAIGSRG